MTNQLTTTGLSFEVALLQSTAEQKEVLQSLSNQRQLQQLRPKFIKALQIDPKLIFEQYQSYYFENINSRDFDGSKNEFELAEIVAIEETLFFAEKLEEKETRYYENKSNRGCILAFE